MKESSADTSQTLVGALRQRLAPRSASSAASYTWPVAISVLFHGVVLLFLAIGWSPGEKPRKVVTPRYVEAQLLQMNAPMVQAPAPQPQPKPQPEPTPEPEPEPEPEPREDTSAREREEQQRQEQQRQEAVKQQQLRDEQLRREQETKARADAERKRQEEQKVREEQAKAEAERKRQEEQKRQEELKRQQAERERQAREAQARAQAQADAEASEQLVGSYLGYIQQRVGSSWSRPPSARLGMVAELEIRLDGQARVTGVRVVKSSGNAAFDQSAEQAVRRVEHFDRLRELIQQDRAAFEQNFRTFILVFNPQDLRQ